MIDFYKRVEAIRVDKGLTKKEFSTKLNIKNSNYATLLKGKTANGELAITLNKLFNVNLNWLLAGVGEMYNSNNFKYPCNFVNYIRELVKKSINSSTSLFLGAVSSKGIETYKQITKNYLEEIGIYPTLIDIRNSKINKKLINTDSVLIFTHIDLFSAIEIGNIITNTLISGRELKSKLILIADITKDSEILEIVNSFCISNLEDNTDTFELVEKMKELESKYKK